MDPQPISVVPGTPNSPDEPSVSTSSFYSGALTRISRFMLALAIVLSIAAWLHYGWRFAMGFALGAVIAHLNFHWLKRVVASLVERVTESGQVRSGKGVVVRFLLRYFLMALAAYAILNLAPTSLSDLFAGLFLPVAAIACEAAYELYVALTRGI